MIYTTGTIAGNGSTITGTGTNFTAAGSLIRVGCTLIAFTNPVQVLQLTAITSGTLLSVTPAISPAIAAGTKFAILLSDSLSVDGLAQDIAETFGMYQKYMGGFADVMNGTGNVTITINGAQVTVPGQKSLAKKGANSDITSLSGMTTALSLGQGGTGSNKPFGNKAGSFCEGNDQRLSTLDGKSGGAVKSRIVFQAASIDSKGITTTDSASASYSDMYSNYESAPMALSQSDISVNSFYPEYADKHYHSGAYAGVFYRGIIHTDAPVVHWGYTSENGTVSAQMLQYRPMTGALYVSGGVTSPVISQTSDEDFKDRIETIAGALQKVESIRGVTFNWKDTGMPSAGVIAQELMAVLPESITTHHVGEQRAYGVEYAGVIGLCVEAIKELSEVVNAQNARIERLAKDLSSL